jgi:hypothetical protein
MSTTVRHHPWLLIVRHPIFHDCALMSLAYRPVLAVRSAAMEVQFSEQI